mgnify:CR=1 FL=1
MERQRGFTLLEMMVVVAIIAILAGILIPNFTRARAQAQTAACIGNMKTIATALELYYTDKQSYPVATTAAIESTFMENTMNGSSKHPAARSRGHSKHVLSANHRFRCRQRRCSGLYDMVSRFPRPGDASKHRSWHYKHAHSV